MTLIAIAGFEDQIDWETRLTVGTKSNVAAPWDAAKRAFRTNPVTTAVGYAELGPVGATGIIGTNFNVANAFMRFLFYCATAPAANSEPIAEFYTSAGAALKAELRINSARQLVVHNSASTLVATGATVLDLNRVYAIDFMAGTGAAAAYEVRINGVVELTGTGNFHTTNHGSSYVGKSSNRNGQSVDYYYDDVLIDDTAYPPAATIVMARPVSTAPTYAAWTAGTGSRDYAEVDETPPDGDTTYIEATATDDAKAHTVRVQTAAQCGAHGRIYAVHPFVVARTGSVSGVSAASMRFRSASVNQDTTGVELLTTYQHVGRIQAVDGASAAFTQAVVDAIEVGMLTGTIAQTQRFTFACVMVVCAGMFDYDRPGGAWGGREFRQLLAT